jgi:hypothetical protein
MNRRNFRKVLPQILKPISPPGNERNTTCDKAHEICKLNYLKVPLVSCNMFKPVSIRCIKVYTRSLSSKQSFQNYWVFGLFPSSGILESRKHNVLETGSISILRWGGKTPILLSPIERVNLNHWTTPQSQSYFMTASLPPINLSWSQAFDDLQDTYPHCPTSKLQF